MVPPPELRRSRRFDPADPRQFPFCLKHLTEESQRQHSDWAAIQATFGQLASVLHHHHHAEEVLLFPGLARTGAPPEDLIGDHQALLVAIEAAEKALVDRHGAAAALARLHTLLHDHLDAEERVAVPYLLAHPGF